VGCDEAKSIRNLNSSLGVEFRGTVGRLWDVLAEWRKKATGPLTGKALKCGHLLPEERPDEVLTELFGFLTG
jgi:hypothetical protein